MDVVKIGVFGGSFDPFHLGHLTLAETVWQHLSLDTVLVVPAERPPHKPNIALTPVAHRIAIIQLAIANRPRLKLDYTDIDRPGPDYTVDTVRLIRQAYNVAADHTYFIIGSDSLETLPTWRKPNQLLAQCMVAAVHRPGYTPDTAALSRQLPALTDRLHYVPMPPKPISATQIRRRIAAGESLQGLVSPTVANYIAAHRLYR